jgi:hypothetical protein
MLGNSELCVTDLYHATVHSTDGDIAYGDTNCYTVLHKPQWMSYFTVGDELHFFGVPLYAQADSLVRVLAVDTKNDSSILEFRLHVYPQPQLLSARKIVAIEDSLCTYRLQFNKPMSVTIGAHPQWLSVDSQQVVGTPDIEHLRDTMMLFTAYDPQCGTTIEDTIFIEVQHVNHAPRLLTDSLPMAVEYAPYEAQIVAADKDTVIEDVRLRYKLIPNTSWLYIDSLTGRLSGTPMLRHLEDTAFQVVVFDQQELSDTGFYTVSIYRLSNDTTLQNICLTAGLDTLNLVDTVASEVENIRIEAIANHPNATVTDTGIFVLNSGSNVFDIKVVAEDTAFSTIYTVSIYRLSNDTTLRSIYVTAGLDT